MSFIKNIIMRVNSFLWIFSHRKRRTLHLTPFGFYFILFSKKIRLFQLFILPRFIIVARIRRKYEQVKGFVYGCPIKAFLGIHGHQRLPDS